MSQLELNTTALQELLDDVNALPDGEGGGNTEITLQEKSVTPTKSAQEVVADSGFDGLSKVNVSAIPDEYIVPSGTKSITENGTHDVTANASVNVNVPIPEGYLKPSGSITVTENGEYDVTEKASVVVAVPDKSEDLDAVIVEQAELIEELSAALDNKAGGGGGASTPTQEKTVSITANGTTVVTPDAGYALSKVTAKVNVPSISFEACTVSLESEESLMPTDYSIKYINVSGELKEITVTIPAASSISLYDVAKNTILVTDLIVTSVVGTAEILVRSSYTDNLGVAGTAIKVYGSCTLR